MIITIAYYEQAMFLANAVAWLLSEQIGKMEQLHENTFLNRKRGLVFRETKFWNIR